MIFAGAVLAAMCAGAAEPERRGTELEKPSRVVFLRQQTENQFLLRGLLGRQVLNPHADHLGSVHDLVVDRNGRVAGILLSVGGFIGLGDKLVGVSWSDVTIRYDGKFVVVNLSREELFQGPEYLSWQQVRHRVDTRALVRSPEPPGAPVESPGNDAKDVRVPPATRSTRLEPNARRQK